MARTIDAIRQQMTDRFIADENIKEAYQLTDGNSFDDEFSAASNEAITFYAHSYGANALEQIFDIFTSDVTDYIANMKPHTLLWYANTAKAFQFGFDLLPDSDQFDNSNATDDQIAGSKVVAYSAVVKQTDAFGRLALRIKTAAVAGGDLAPLTEEQLNALIEYFDRVGDAGVPLNIDSQSPDSLKMTWTIYYDPLILDNSGNRLDGTATDVIRTAIKNYLLALPFNGTFALQYVGDAVEAVDGVVLFNIDLAQSKYGNFDFTNIATYVVPDAGYLRFASDDDLIINYVAQSPIK